MKLKRIFDEDKNPTQVLILRKSDPWNVSPRTMDKGISEGWMSIAKGTMTLHTPDGDVKYDIASPPDRSEGKHYFHCVAL